jgi:predicted Ser/Thr protein kinase
VLAHVRVERVYVSERYRQAAVTIGPQMAVDAQERQITVDRSLASLPASLASLSLYETHGELVEAAGGILEFSDLLKRPLDAWRYLLLAVEEGEIALSSSVLPLNAVFVATSNDIHLKAFREHHEYRSFRGRLSLVRVPYLLDYRQEQGIYDAQIVPQVRTHVAPHATYVAALWALLTRLRRPQVEGYENKKLGQLASSLTPIEKAEYYSDLQIPNRFSNEESQLLRAGFHDVRHETDTWPSYEGSSGASPREIRTLLLDAAQDPQFSCLSPLAVLQRIRELCEADDYDFLKETPESGYHDHRGFVDVVRERWLDRVDDEFRRSTGLVEETQYLDLFDKYVTHVSNWVKRERVYNTVTGQYEEPDPKLMENLEGMLGVTRNNESFRRDLISTVAAHAIDHPGEKPNYPRLFPRYLQQVREATYGKRKKQLSEIARDVLSVLSKETSQIDQERQQKARGTIERLGREHGYTETSIRDAIGELLRRRYAS